MTAPMDMVGRCSSCGLPVARRDGFYTGEAWCHMACAQPAFNEALRAQRSINGAGTAYEPPPIPASKRSRAPLFYIPTLRAWLWIVATAAAIVAASIAASWWLA